MILVSDNGIERTLGKILATQEAILSRIDKHDTKLEKHIEDDKVLEKRVVKLESRFMYAAGWVIGLITIFSITSDILLAQLGITK